MLIKWDPSSNCFKIISEAVAQGNMLAAKLGFMQIFASELKSFQLEKLSDKEAIVAIPLPWLVPDESFY